MTLLSTTGFGSEMGLWLWPLQWKQPPDLWFSTAVGGDVPVTEDVACLLGDGCRALPGHTGRRIFPSIARIPSPLGVSVVWPH
ncbi:hypothetical protein VULLAG_LOCUS11675 [Vulpes lagopus]